MSYTTKTDQRWPNNNKVLLINWLIEQAKLREAKKQAQFKSRENVILTNELSTFSILQFTSLWHNLPSRMTLAWMYELVA